MKWYADDPRRRARQVALDIGVVLWCWLWIRVAAGGRNVVLRLQEPGQLLEKAGTSLAGGLDDAASRVSGAPLIGGRLRDPLAAAANAGRAVADAGATTGAVVARLALVLALVIALLPIAAAMFSWLPHRLRYAREAAAAVRLRREVDLLALRAATTLPLSRLARLGPDTVTRWRRGDPVAVQQLAALTLAEYGLRPAAPAINRQ